MTQIKPECCLIEKDSPDLTNIIFSKDKNNVKRLKHKSQPIDAKKSGS